jgi:hypothetical protein
VVTFLDHSAGNADTQAVVLKNKRLLIVVFVGSEGRGTSAIIRDWLLTDLRIAQVPIGQILVHKGFRDAVEPVYPELKELIATHLKGRRSLWLTGHSLGGALANLTAYRLEEDGIKVQGVYTYAAPRVGDSAWAAEFEQRLRDRSQQWSSETDPVPRTPPESERWDYEEVGITNVIQPGGGIDLDTLLDSGLALNILNHKMAAYLHGLYRALPADLQEAMPLPPPMCGPGQKQVGVHPETGHPLCKTLGSTKITAGKCRGRGGVILDGWCVIDVGGELRHTVRPLKGR